MTFNRFCRTSVFGLLFVAGCAPFSGFVYDEPLDGPYRLNAVDVDEDMSICWSAPNGDCVGDGLPGPTVFAVGYNKSYVVAAVHPRQFGDSSNRTVTQYYYVVRSSNESQKLPYSGIKGPFDEDAYNVEKGRLHLPEFTRTFDNLR